MENVSSVFMFSLTALNLTTANTYLFFSLTALTYNLILLFNITIVFCIASDKQLHEPMYIFLCNLCINAIFGTSGFYPKFLYDLLSQLYVISYAGCLIQVFVIYSSVLCDYSILTVMAYDRYVAICRPLQYHSEMTNQMIIKCILFCWLPPCISVIVAVLLAARLTLCGSTIEKLYCENWAVVKLACSSTTVNDIFGYILILVYFGHVVLIAFSYKHLINNRRKSKESRYKFMQTCVPHLLALFNISIAILFDAFYSRYGSTSFPQGLRNFMSLDFLFIPPILNPLIYGLKLSKIWKKVMRLFFRYNVSQKKKVKKKTQIKS